jgi:hypothetical protein
VNRRFAACATALALALGAGAGRAAEDWRTSLTPPGALGAPRAWEAKYSLGWAGVTAGNARATFRHEAGRLRLTGSGATAGFARKLWEYDAEISSTADSASLAPRACTVIEKYPGWSMTTQLDFAPEQVHRLRTVDPPGKEIPKRKRFKLPAPRDLLGALLAIQSQPLAPGDRYRLVVFPTSSPYLAEVTVVRREKIKVAAGRFDALRLDLKLKRINKAGRLEPHKKFRRATAWLSDDRDHLLLRAEAEIFVGSVWAELDAARTGPRP